ncbi:hypothetical protein [Streptomyces sp. MNU103]|uniref:hypothetical protein n=1 Tax=Streptomyces sp. MNU103 TaxID=2560024 RepID=UPI001E33CCC3|nr:hypothetical protein [Streptomyces sp. MNU103]
MTTTLAPGQAPTGLDRLAALMRTRQHWRNGRLVSEGTLTQAEVRTALGWTEPAEPPAVTYDPARLGHLRHLGEVAAADPAAFPDVTDAWLAGQARQALPELLALVDDLAARVEELQARACRCYDPTAHVPGCGKAVILRNGRTLPATVWYQDPEGDWWLPVAVDASGRLVLQLDGDPLQGPSDLDDLEAGYGPLTPSPYGAHLERRHLPEGIGPQAAHRAVSDHLEDCLVCRAKGPRPELCWTGQELTLAAAALGEQTGEDA